MRGTGPYPVLYKAILGSMLLVVTSGGAWKTKCDVRDRTWTAASKTSAITLILFLQSSLIFVYFDGNRDGTLDVLSAEQVFCQ